MRLLLFRQVLLCDITSTHSGNVVLSFVLSRTVQHWALSVGAGLNLCVFWTIPPRDIAPEFNVQVAVETGFTVRSPLVLRDEFFLVHLWTECPALDSAANVVWIACAEWGCRLVWERENLRTAGVGVGVAKMGLCWLQSRRRKWNGLNEWLLWSTHTAKDTCTFMEQ